MNMNPTAFRCRLPRSGGFTLIELLAVLGIMAILALATIPYAHLHQARLKEVQLRTALREIRSALDAYKRASDEGRVSRVADASGYPPDLRTLVDGVEDLRSPTRARLFFLRRLPRDPFADPALPAEQTWTTRSYASPPDDPRPGADVFDVFSRSSRTGLDGKPYKDW